ncbi:uncharacterized protein LAESUDRAFT_720260 [Laetiporus sulphureus 93-53]|uniref:Secreted protein n=1 Tax=Laetiporus sulphureus 93-53 TaxID=1314785 RepID=A0A165HX47_9APHY|nr:uncharacterized protein LAESUDRAFT_720260 [Laetiporus sulphureus 93-53]KZT12305.1 hypothetical protein LAESUDRAFT_720260 [Laetiporus sulphureus 93-53]
MFTPHPACTTLALFHTLSLLRGVRAPAGWRRAPLIIRYYPPSGSTAHFQKDKHAWSLFGAHCADVVQRWWRVSPSS